ncbi:hypothetical protein Q4488_16605 [Amphritea sp. 1_MG-2023]|uniref:hypothetical protein n=1 Tax=Amphritea sp. 1_MG-2023 TaxID=3062670 RepID=UPI0026E1A52D|nr:hypothetical protein [Amphritea sp. 1_MG-2023]MDO6565003.1 hypothetical protein [Amphritea sp. 1_MG-2023]
MILKRFSELPVLETEPGTDCSFISHNPNGESLLTVVYATKRDFLSVPKSYTAVQFKGSDSLPLEFHAVSRQDYLEQLELANSWFKSGAYEIEKTKDYTIVLLLTNDRALEIIFTEFELLGDSYHSVDAQTALLESLKGGVTD